MFAWLLLVSCVSLENGLAGPPGGEDASGPVDDGVEGIPGREVSERRDGPATPEDATLPPEDEDPDAEALYAEGTIHEFHLSIPDEGRAALALAPKEWVAGQFRAGRTTYDVAIRLKGTTTYRPLSGKAAFKIDFAEYDPEQRFHGRKRLTLNSMLQDSSMLHEHVSYWLYRHRGVPAPRHSFARVWVDGEYYGLYGVVETMDEQFLKRNFPDDDDGNLFEANLVDFVPGQAGGFEIEESPDLADPHAGLRAVIDDIAAAPPDRFFEALSRHFDVDVLLRMWAIDLASGNVDGYTRLRNNYMVYQAVNSGRWYITPWGHDQAMQWHRDVASYRELSGHLVQRCGEDPACASALTAAIEDLVVDWESGELAVLVSDVTSLVAPDCRADPRAEYGCDIGHVLPFVLERPASIRESLAEAAVED
ncbi:MAG: CotH kinase family protein [Myxococcota bacterium]